MTYPKGRVIFLFFFSMHVYFLITHRQLVDDFPPGNRGHDDVPLEYARMCS